MIIEKYVCDRCGKEFDVRERHGEVIYPAKFTLKDFFNGKWCLVDGRYEYKHKTIELCQNCYDETVKFLRGTR